MSPLLTEWTMSCAFVAVALILAFTMHRRVPSEMALRVTFLGDPRMPLLGYKPNQMSVERPNEVSKEPAKEEEGPVRFLIDALLLHHFYVSVCQHPANRSSDGRQGFREVFHYATGLRVSKNCFVIGHLVPVQFSHQSATRVRVADRSNIETLTALDEMGLPLVAHAHSHPSFGPGGTLPSETDRRFQERLYRGGHCAIGFIFSRDGYCRVFGHPDQSFVVEVQGNHVKQVDQHVYELQLAHADLPVTHAAY